jgi:hypothetical protein
VQDRRRTSDHVIDVESAAPGSRLILDGLMIGGRGIRVRGHLASLTLRHCTLVPGWSTELGPDWSDRQRAEVFKRPGYNPPDRGPSLILENLDAQVTIDHSILGWLVVNQSHAHQEPVPITVQDSIIDATHQPDAAIAASHGVQQIAYAALTLRRCTVFGQLRVHALPLAENTIFTDPLLVARQQLGCVRFCYVPSTSRTPRCFHCQPDQALQDLKAEFRQKHGDLQHLQAEQDLALNRVQPRFTSTQYGTPGYAQLSPACPPEIQRGADDESEMGVFHSLFNPQREANLRGRIAEYTPIERAIGVIYAS